jgi:hypothetical protein
LNRRLRPGLVARSQQRVITEADDVPLGQTVPDVMGVKRPRGRRGATGGAVGHVALAEPVLVTMPVEYSQPYIEIIDVRTGGAVITVIEVVSASNKRAGNGRRQYVQKQTEVLSSRTNLVEIDLIRGGTGVTLASKWQAPPASEAAFHISVWRATAWASAEVYPLPLRQALPTFGIPLHAADEDVALDLQSVIDQTYVEGRYTELIDYDRPCEPTLEPEDAAWAAERVREWREGLKT